MNPEQAALIENLIGFLQNFRSKIVNEDIRTNVLSLIPAIKNMQDIGKSLIPEGLKISARDRILAYFLKYPGIVISSEEIMIVSGISEWARRVRELRVEFGWPIISGITAMELKEDEVSAEWLPGILMNPNDYILTDTNQDKEAAYRWNVANDIRKSGGGMKERILTYFRCNVGKAITGEELRYVADGSEWARRVRELRTEEGWPISTKTSGRPDLPVGVYMLERDIQARSHDRRIPDPIRSAVLRRDEYSCVKCHWNQSLWNMADPRYLELHHKMHHKDGGENTAENLITLCNVCHDEIHSLDR